jgi:hypothetical protein
MEEAKAAILVDSGFKAATGARDLYLEWRFGMAALTYGSGMTAEALGNRGIGDGNRGNRGQTGGIGDRREVF